MSIEFEDLDVHTSTGKLLPPLKNVQSYEGATGRVTEKDLRRTKSLYGASTRPASARLALRPTSASKQDAALTNHGVPLLQEWVGDPEVINSIRRPRKSIAKQKLEFAMARSANIDGSRPVYKPTDAARRSLCLSDLNSLSETGSSRSTSGAPPLSPGLLSPTSSVRDLLSPRPEITERTCNPTARWKHRRGGSLKRLSVDKSKTGPPSPDNVTPKQANREFSPRKQLMRHHSFHV